jgi:uncharacterized protein
VARLPDFMSRIFILLVYTRAMNRRRFLQLMTLGSLGLAGSVPTYAWSEAHRFGVSKHSFKLPRLERGLRVAHLSDLHFGRWHREPAIRKWVDATLAQNPDLIVITGDLVDGRTSIERLEAFTAELARLGAPLGVFATWGNHDYAMHHSGLAVFGPMLEKVGIRVLTNEGAQVRPDLYLAGVDDYWHGEVDVARAIHDANPTGATLLLSHNPDILPSVPSSVGLMLSGHTHGGQVRAPFGVGLHSISKFGERYQMGFVQEQTTAFVSRGLGTSTVPVRSFCPAELVLLELQA